MSAPAADRRSASWARAIPMAAMAPALAAATPAAASSMTISGAGVGVGNLKVLQGCLGATHPWLARDLRLVDVGGERLGRPGRLAADAAPLLLHQLAQRLPPRFLVRRIDEHAVDVEDRSLEP